MAAAAINAEIEKLVKADSALAHELIAAGRGHERPSEYLKKDDPLSRKARALFDRRHALRMEVELRAGPGMTRLPRGFGPRKNPIHRAGKGWQWGKHGAIYPTREQAVKQAQAAYAHGYREKPKARKRKRNPGFTGPSSWYIHIQRYAGNRGIGPVMIYNGKSFSDRPDARPYAFSSQAAAASMARRLVTNNRKLSVYKVWVAPMLYGEAKVDRAINPKRRKNPAPASLDEAAKKLEEFTGRPARDVIESEPRSTDKTGLVIGELDLIGYRQAREGIDGGRMTRFAHKFRKNSRPLLAVSTDGKQLHIVGGQYEFTDAGIEDR